MKWIKDTTGRFPKRPHYLPEELDASCEAIVREFLIDRHGRVDYPIRTDDLTVLLERDAKDLDLYADFSGEEGEIEGVTEFRNGEKPRVRIAARLTNSLSLENRLRTTLTHEYGHVHFHNSLFQASATTGNLFEAASPSPLEGTAHRCNRDAMLSMSGRDWMEWQAGYVCGAMLIPIQPLIKRIREFRLDMALEDCSIAEGEPEGIALIQIVSEDFQTSRDAARVRLLQKGYLTLPGQQSLL